jgi:hypothetical protein
MEEMPGSNEAISAVVTRSARYQYSLAFVERLEFEHFVSLVDEKTNFLSSHTRL